MLRNWFYNWFLRFLLVILLLFVLTGMNSCSSKAPDTKTAATQFGIITTADSVSLAMLLDKAWDWRNKNADSCRYYTDTAMRLAVRVENRLGQAEAFNRYGNLEEAAGHFDAAIAFYKKAALLDSLAGYKHGMARDANQIATILAKNGRCKPALQQVQRAIVIWLQLSGSEKSLVLAYTNCGNIWMRLGEAEKALLQFQKALLLAEKSGTKQAEALNSIGYVYEKQHQFERAFSFYLQALRMEEKQNNLRGIATANNNLGKIYYQQGKFNEALQCYRKSIALKNEIGYKQGTGSTLNNIGSVYEVQGDLSNALDYYRKSYDVDPEAGDQQERAIVANNIGVVMKRMGKNAEAMRYFREAFEIAQRIGARLLLIEILKNISESAALSGDYNFALDCNRKLLAIRDSVERSMGLAAEKDALYQEEQTRRKVLEKENEKQQIEFQRQKTESRNQQILIYAILIVATLLLLSLFLAWRFNREKQQRLIAVQQDKINREQTDKLIRNQENTILRSMFEAQEKERQRIASDLHDRLGLKLSTARLYYSMFTKHLNALDEEEQKQFSNGNQILDEACDELRKVAHNLASGELMRFGLVQAVNRLCETLMQASNLKISCYNSGIDDRLDSHTELQLYLIVQELLTNVFRHAKATEVTVQFSRYNHTLNVIVEDNGVGFPADKITNSEGIGLKSIQERTIKLNGTLQIDSLKGRGTTISIDITLT